MAKMGARIGPIHADEMLMAANLNQAPSHTLSGQEAQILLLIAAGKQTADIAADVGGGQAAVKDHIKSILRKAKGSHGQAKRPRGYDLHPLEFPPEMLSPFIA